MKRAILAIVFVALAAAGAAPAFSGHHVHPGDAPPARAWYPREAARAPSAPGAGVPPPSGPEPAPMGMADFGLSSSGTYSYSSTEFEGELNATSLRVDNASLGPAAAQLTAQLNVVLKFVDGGATYYYWIQNVELIDTSTGQTQFNNNIWNFSQSGAVMLNSSVSGNGSVQSSPEGGFYAFVDSASLQTLPSPYFTYVDVSSFVNASGVPVVDFAYGVGSGPFVTYDTVSFPFATSVSVDDNFVVDGGRPTPAFTYIDAEFVLGGPGGGSQTSDLSSNATMRLYYWNGHNFQTPTNAYNVGGDTAEGIRNVRATYAPDASGSLWTGISAGSGTGTPGRLYSRAQIGLLSVEQTTIPSGWLILNNSASWFFRDSANLTIAPGTYAVTLKNFTGGALTSLGSCTLTAGGSLLVTPSRPCATVPTPTIASFVATPTATDLGHLLAFTVSATGGTGTFGYAYAGLPTGCVSTNTSVLSCRPSGTGAFTVTVTVTDSAGQSARAQVHVTVNALPSATLMIQPAGVDVGHAARVDVAVSGGTAPFSFSFTGLPTECPGQSGSFACSPSRPGAYSVSVTVSDADGGTATASAAFLVAMPPSVQSFAQTGTASQGQRLTLTVTAVGGVPPLSYSYAGLPRGCASENSATLSCVPSVSGAYVVTVTVSDANGVRAAPDTITLSIAASSGSGFGLGSPWLWVALGAIVLAIAVGVGLALSRRRAPPGPVVWAPATTAPAGSVGFPPAGGVPARGFSPPPRAPPPRTQPAQCPNCGAVVPVDAYSCPRCATRLTP